MENERFLQELKERLVKEFNYNHQGGNSVILYNQYLPNKENCDYPLINGLVAHLEEVYRHNGTNENKSVEVNFIFWKHPSGRTLDRIKIRQDASERQINNFVNKVIKRYKELESENY